MSAGNFFTLGTKWIGVYCLAQAAGELFDIFSLTFADIPELRRSLPRFQWSHWLSILGPAAFLTIGIYLIRGGSYVRKFALRSDAERIIRDSKDFFDVAIKLYGVYFVAGSVPSCVWVLANVLIVLRSAPYLSVSNEMEAIRSYLPPVLTTIGLGMCCLIWSSRFTGLAFRRSRRRLLGGGV
jgi:hypothetical protein